jgi:hypothetical protein
VKLRRLRSPGRFGVELRFADRRGAVPKPSITYVPPGVAKSLAEKYVSDGIDLELLELEHVQALDRQRLADVERARRPCRAAGRLP